MGFDNLFSKENKYKVRFKSDKSDRGIILRFKDENEANEYARKNKRLGIFVHKGYQTTQPKKKKSDPFGFYLGCGKW